MPALRAVLFDFGGVLSTSPFEAFARYEREHDLPVGFIRTVNATNADDNAWARLERGASSLTEFDARFRAEAVELGHDVPGTDVLGLLLGDVRPEMVEAVRRCKQQFATALLTNNFAGMGGFGHTEPRDPAIGAILDLFDVVIESSVVGIRKPDPRFYELACEALGITPPEAVFLDDLGINLKPARELGMATIKVVDAAQALDELEAITGLPLR